MTGGLRKTRMPDRDRADAARLQRAGTKGDTILAHINPQEAGLLDWLADQKIDATRNPKTGLLSFGDNDSDDGGGISGGSGHDSFGGGYSGGGSMSDSTNDGGASPWGGSLSMTPGIAGMSLDQLSAIDKSLADAIDENDRGIFGGVGPRTDGWASPETGYRVLQELWNGPAYNAPGRYGMPTGVGPGVFGTVAANFGGPVMSGMMGLGAALGRAQGPAAQERSMAANQALGSRNSTGNENARVGPRRTDALGSPVAGSGSGGSGGLLGNGTAQSAAAGTTSPDGGIASPTVQPGQVMDTSGRSNNTLTGLPPVVQNLLMDYVWRGRQGTGFNW